MFEKFINSKTTKMKDLSFWNLFWKRFIICLCVSLPICIGLYAFCDNMVMKYTHAEIGRNLNEKALGMVEYLTSDMYDSPIAMATNIDLAVLKEEIDDLPCTSQASISAYNLTEKKILSKSFEVLKLNSDAAYQWWSKLTPYDEVYPKISVDNELLSFCQKYRNETLIVNKMAIINSVLFPYEMVARNSDGKDIDSCTVFVQQLDDKYYYNFPAEVELIGNEAEDRIYELMSDYTIAKNPTTGEIEISYVEEKPENVFCKTVVVHAGEEDYQIDCMYTASFWHGYFLYIVLAELMCLLGCAIISAVSAKFTSNIYNK